MPALSVCVSAALPSQLIPRPRCGTSPALPLHSARPFQQVCALYLIASVRALRLFSDLLAAAAWFCLLWFCLLLQKPQSVVANCEKHCLIENASNLKIATPDTVQLAFGATPSSTVVSHLAGVLSLIMSWSLRPVNIKCLFVPLKPLTLLPYMRGRYACFIHSVLNRLALFTVE